MPRGQNQLGWCICKKDLFSDKLMTIDMVATEISF